jgi:septal ring-binding cell division protein DamX
MNATATPTHPVEPDPSPDERSDEAPTNPTQLPVEPEFGQALPQAEPEDPGVQKPTL